MLVVRGRERYEVVLALSGKADGWNGWGRALHQEADEPNERVSVRAGVTTVVCLSLTIGPPTRLVRRWSR